MISTMSFPYSLVKFSSNRSIEEAASIYQQRIEDALWVYEKHHHNFITRSCFCCGSKDTSAIEPFQNTYGVHQCNWCNSLFVNPAPNPEALADYYNYGKCNELLGNLLKKRFSNSSDFIMDERVQFVMSYIRKLPGHEVNLLEIGCNSGTFLAKLQYFLRQEIPEKTVHLFGIDIDNNSISAPVDNDLNLSCANAENYVKSAFNQFDLILHFELIEHLVDPFTFSKNTYDLLKPGGYVIFTTPNANGLEMIASPYNQYRLLAHAIFPPMHLNAFSTTNMTHFALRAGFQMIHMDTPGKLDVDMVTLCQTDVEDEGLRLLADYDDNTKALIQHIVNLSGLSSHMRCVFQKSLRTS
jgi:2-polyprenyl-6-hydroxyphenyl methylase/3-demethylubiquinone-9 3-methyltransferase